MEGVRRGVSAAGGPRSNSTYLDEIIIRVPVCRKALVPVDKLGDGIINSIHHCGCLGRCPAVAKPVRTRRLILSNKYFAFPFVTNKKLGPAERWCPLARCRACSKRNALVGIW